MEKITLSGSFFLFPGNKVWKDLEKDFKVKFYDYGNLGGALSKTSEKECLVLIFFLNQLIENPSLSTKELKNRISPLLNLIKKRAKKCQKPFLTFISEGEYFNLIRTVKNVPNLTKIFYWLKNELQEISKNNSNFFVVDLDLEFSLVGKNNVFDNRNLYLASCPLSYTGLEIISNSIKRLLHRYYKSASKVLILDCDNTLWGGVVGEDGLEGIILGEDGLGKAFVDFQKKIKKISEEGVILALASKNNEKDVWEVFDKDQSMILKKENITIWKINWKEKFENLKEISKELDLGLDSFVFWDDNPIERDKMKSFLPDVTTVDVPKDVFEWKDHLSNLDCLSKFSITKDDLKKNKQYKSRANFIRDKKSISNENQYLKSIKLKPTAFSLNEANITRAEQLCAKTNQFNLRTIRHKAKNLKEFSKKNKDFCFLTKLEDIYGDHGIISLTCLKELNKDYLFLDTFLMSCRILGRHLESWILKEILRRTKANKYKFLVGEYIQTKKNSVASNFFSSLNFEPLKLSNNNILKKLLKKEINSNSRKLFIISSNFKQIPFIDIYE